MEGSLASGNTRTSSLELRFALMTCTEEPWTQTLKTVDQYLVLLNVNAIQRDLWLIFPSYQAILDILLCRSDPHIAQIHLF